MLRGRRAVRRPVRSASGGLVRFEDAELRLGRSLVIWRPGKQPIFPPPPEQFTELPLVVYRRTERVRDGAVVFEAV